MCYSKSQRSDDNRRCDAHKFGTQASVEMSSHIGNVPLKFASKVNADLRKEGKGLPDPSQEEVQQFVAQQVFTAKYDSNIPENRRNTIVKRWRKAQDEKPSGGLMHAWKNNLSESIIRYRRTAMASILGASIIATSACGSVPPQQNNTPPAPETSVTAPANPSETAKPTETVKPSSTAKPTVKSKEIKALESQGIEISDTVEIADGSYPSYEVKQGSKLATYNPSLQSGGVPEGWKKSDMDKAQHKASNFLMNTVLNNQTRTSYYSNIKSLEKTFEKEVAPEYREEFINSIQSNDETPLMKDIFEDPTGQYADYTLINDGKTPRIKNVDAKVIESQSWNGDNYFVFKGTYTLSAMNKKTKKPRDIDAKFEYGITIRKSGDGKFYIVGANGIEGLYENIN